MRHIISIGSFGDWRILPCAAGGALPECAALQAAADVFMTETLTMPDTVAGRIANVWRRIRGERALPFSVIAPHVGEFYIDVGADGNVEIGRRVTIDEARDYLETGRR